MLLLVFFLHCAWTESFETQNHFPPNGWIIVNEDALDACWYRDTTEGHTSVHAATCYNDTAYAGLLFTNLDYLITPQVLPQAVTNDTLLSFWYRATSSAGCSLDIMVSILSPPEMPSFNLLQSFYISETSWTQQVVSLNSYNDIPIYIAFRMRKIPVDQQFYLDDITLSNMTAQPHICNGRLRTKGPPSQKYLQVWGSHNEMGYAHGFLLGEEIMANFTRVIVGTDSFHFYSPTEYENDILPYYRSHFYIPQKYQDEAQGMYNGMFAKGVDLNHPELGRELTMEDILCINADPDFIVSGCSNISGWGESTINDDTLQGGMIIARNTDGGSGQYTSMGNTSLIIAFAPDSSGEQKFFMVGGAGNIGCGAGVNQQGVGICRNTGNHPDTANIPPNSLIPIALSHRNAIEIIDPDSNGLHDIFDIIYTIDHSTCLNTKDTHLFSRYDAFHPIPAGILEMNNIADSLRLVSDNNLLPDPINSDWNLAVTNHDRVLYSPVDCWRYQRIADSLNVDFHLTTERAIAISNAVARGITLQSLVFRPDMILDHPDWHCVGVSYAYRNEPAHVHTKLWYSWNELFEDIPSIVEHVSKPVKKYYFGATIISGQLQLPHDKKCKVFDITGRQVKMNRLSPGIYFIQTEDKVIQKIVKIR